MELVGPVSLRSSRGLRYSSFAVCETIGTVATVVSAARASLRMKLDVMNLKSFLIAVCFLNAIDCKDKVTSSSLRIGSEEVVERPPPPSPGSAEWQDGDGWGPHGGPPGPQFRRRGGPEFGSWKLSTEEAFSGERAVLERSIPNRFLYGVSYYPWRNTTNCSDLSEENIRQDFDVLTKVARGVQIFELYCDFAPLILNLTNRESMHLLMGISVTDEEEFRRQKHTLASLLQTGNMSQVLGITVGRSSMFNTTDRHRLQGKVREIEELVRASAYPDIPVSMIRDAPEFDHLVTGSTKIVSISRTVKPEEDPLKFFHSWLKEPRFHDRKDSYFTEFGYPFDFDSKTSTAGGHGSSEPEPEPEPGPDPLMFALEEITCLGSGRPLDKRDKYDPRDHHGGPRPPPPPKPIEVKYFYHSAFDMAFEYGPDDPRAHWGLASGVSRQLKQGLLRIVARRGPGPFAENRKCMDIIRDMNAMPHDDKPPHEVVREQWIAIGVALGLALLAVIALIALSFHRRKKHRDDARQKKLLEQQLASVHADRHNNNAYIRTLATYLSRQSESYVDLITKSDYENLSALVSPEWQIEETDIRFEEIIGEGHFGIVQRGTLTRYGETVDVAVKRLHVGAKNVRQFLSEGILMEQFHHPNVLPLVGISFTSYYLPMIITPFMQKGDLLSYVKNGENRLTVRQLLKFGLEIAEGMNYMHELKLIHRDLAARNCMLDDSLTVRIADFGLCRDVSDSDSYQTARASDIPIRWMPPETIEKLEWTNRSDVWSYGVVLWELFTRGKQPYTRVPLVELRAFLRSGGRLPKPDGCPDVIYDLMKNCWHGQAEQRPPFSQLCESIPALVKALEGEQILDVTDYYNSLTVMEMSQQQSVPPTADRPTERGGA